MVVMCLSAGPVGRTYLLKHGSGRFWGAAVRGDQDLKQVALQSGWASSNQFKV